MLEVTVTKPFGNLGDGNSFLYLQLFRRLRYDYGADLAKKIIKENDVPVLLVGINMSSLEMY